MKRIVSLFLAAVCCLCFTACNKVRKEAPPLAQEETIHLPPEESVEIVQDVELVGPWHLDGEKNDLAAFADSLELFPGYGEWGASMEIRSNGQMSWYIGAESWHGTYTVEDGVMQAQLTQTI